MWINDKHKELIIEALEHYKVDIFDVRVRYPGAKHTDVIERADAALADLAQHDGATGVDEWVPVEDGRHGDVFVENNGEDISIYVDEEYGYVGDDLPKNIRLCKRAAVPAVTKGEL